MNKRAGSHKGAQAPGIDPIAGRSAAGFPCIYRIDRSDRIIEVNQAWRLFARENGAPELAGEAILGQPVDRFIADWDTRQLYALIYRKVRDKGIPVTLSLRCDSPALRRFLRLTLGPAKENGIEFVVRTLRIEPREPVRVPPSGSEWEGRIVGICSWCERIRIDDEHWVEVEQALETLGFFAEEPPPRLSHGICPACYAGVRKAIGG